MFVYRFIEQKHGFHATLKRGCVVHIWQLRMMGKCFNRLKKYIYIYIPLGKCIACVGGCEHNDG